jgi:hypothetical protein
MPFNVLAYADDKLFKFACVVHLIILIAHAVPVHDNYTYVLMIG